MKRSIIRNLYIQSLSIFTMALICLSLFVAKGANAAGAQIPYSFFLEGPYSITGMKTNVEFINLDDDGWLIMNSLRIDVNVYENLFGLYAKFPFSGVTDFGVNGESDYDFGNLSLGGKAVMLNLDNAALTGGLEVFFPTTDDGFGAFGAQRYFRDVAAFADDALTINPYLVFGISGGDIFAFQANLDFNILTDANRLDRVFDTGGDDTELIVKYGGTVSVTPDLPLPFSTSFLVELLLASSTSFDDNITGAYLTPGFRVGGQIFSAGVGVEIPFGSDEVTDFANVGFLLDFMVRFGS
ncbi:hypothetical protein MYX76_16095 [Desulfobacterota bacterium AH_259_B03_O07]|nr:hypothetical protein [Desulfobacterota bacterium AH_259_B03_O07]